MTSVLLYSGPAFDGELPERSKARLASTMRKLAGKNVRLELVEAIKPRSNKANAYYWACVVRSVTQMFQECGNYVDDEDVHEFLKLRVGKLSRVVVTPDGEVIKTVGSTKKLTASQFSDYIEKIKAWAAEMGLEIPEADQFLNQGRIN